LFSWNFSFFYLTNFAFFFSFFGWQNLDKNLKTPILFYEEASWFDFQIWEKSFFLEKNDKLLRNQKIIPFLKKKIQNYCFIGFFGILFLI
jgi:hypothetical protein